MKMSLWERLEKYGHIKNLKRKGDPHNYNIILENGLVKIECTRRQEYHKVTIDTFLHLFMNNLPCEYPQYIEKEKNV